MKKLIILGNSIAAVKAAEIIKSQNNDFEITLLPLDACLPVDRQLFSDQIVNQSKVKQLLYRPKEFYDEKSINIISDKKVTRVNVTRKKVHFEDRSQKDFDILVIADTPEYRAEEIKGSRKAGVFGFKKIQDIDQITTLAALNETITIQSDQWSGIGLALRLARKNKDVVLSVSSKNAFLHGLDEEMTQWVLDVFKQKKIQLLIDNPITEILGESDIKAVKVKSGKVFASELAVLEQTKLDLRVFSEGLEVTDERFIVDEQFRSNFEYVFVVDHAAHRTQDDGGSYGALASGLEFQGQVLASAILGIEVEGKAPIKRYLIEEDGMFLMSIGQVAERRGVSVSVKYIAELGVLVKLFEKDGLLMGVLAVNSGINPDNAVNHINAQADIQSYREEIFKALDDRLASVQEYDSWVERQIEGIPEEEVQELQSHSPQAS